MADGKTISVVIEARDQASAVFRSVTNSARGFATGVNGTITSFNAALRGYNNAMRGFNNVVTQSLRNAGRAIYGFTADAITQFAELERQHSKTMGAMQTDYKKTAEDQKRFIRDGEALKQQAITLGTLGPDGNGSLYTPQEVSQAQTALVKAGKPADQLVGTDMVEQVIKFAGGNDLDLTTAAEFAVQASTVFKIPDSKWGEMLDKATYAADISIIDVEDIIQSFKYAGTPAGFNASYDEILAALSTMGNAGLKGAQAGTGIQAIYARSLSPTGITSVTTPPTKEVEEIYNGFSASVTDDQGNFLGLENFTDQLQEQTSGLSDAEKSWFYRKIFGMFQQKAAVALGRTGEDGENVFTEMVSGISDMSAGTIDTKWELMLGSMFGNLESLKNAYEGIKVDVGDRLQPIVNEVSKQAFNWLTDPDNYEFDFTTLKEAINKSGELIGEKYGEQIGQFVSELGIFAVDSARVAGANLPTVQGVAGFTLRFLSGDFDGAFESLYDGLDETEDKISELPPELQDAAKGLRNLILILAAISGLNVVTRIAEFATSLLRLPGSMLRMFIGNGKSSGISSSVNTTINATNASVNATHVGVNASTANATINALTANAARVDVFGTVVNVYGSGSGLNNPGGSGLGGQPLLPSGPNSPLLLPPSSTGGQRALPPTSEPINVFNPNTRYMRNPLTGQWSTPAAVASFAAKGVLGLGGTAAFMATQFTASNPDTMKIQDELGAMGQPGLDYMKNIYQTREGAGYLRSKLQDRITTGGEVDENFLRELFSYEKDGMIYKLSQQDVSDVLNSLYTNEYKTPLIYSGYANKSIDKFVRGNTNYSELSQLPSIESIEPPPAITSIDPTPSNNQSSIPTLQPIDGINNPPSPSSVAPILPDKQLPNGVYGPPVPSEIIKPEISVQPNISTQSQVNNVYNYPQPSGSSNPTPLPSETYGPPIPPELTKQEVPDTSNVTAAMDANNVVLNNILGAVNSWSTENIIQISNPQPTTNVDVYVTVDESGNVINKQIIPNYSGYDDYIYRQTQRYGGTR